MDTSQNKNFNTSSDYQNIDLGFLMP